MCENGSFRGERGILPSFPHTVRVAEAQTEETTDARKIYGIVLARYKLLLMSFVLYIFYFLLFLFAMLRAATGRSRNVSRAIILSARYFE